MDLDSQEAIKKLADEHGTDNLLVILGAPDPESAEIAAETVVLGDPSYAGPLAEVQLGLPVYHVLEDEVKNAIPDEEWEEEIGLMVEALEKEALCEAVASMRGKKEEEE